MRKTDWLWVLAYPIYQVIGTIRHESGHALAAWIQGAKITKFVFLPGIRNGQLYFGYVNWEGATNWVTTAAPYFLDLVTFLIFFTITFRGKFKRYWLWINIVIFGVISPLLNSGYQYIKPGLSPRSDIGWLLKNLPAGWVHIYMSLTLLLYLGGTNLLFRRSRYIRERNTIREEEINHV